MKTGELMARLGALGNSRDDIEEFNRLVFGGGLHSGQHRFIQSATAQVNLLSPGNSWGKTEMVAREAVRRCWYKSGVLWEEPMEWLHADYRALICSYEYGIAGESFQRLANLYNQGGNFHKLVEQIWFSEGSQKVKFKNGAILDFGSLKDNGRHVEAVRRNLIIVDEVGQIPDFEKTFDDVLYPRTMGVSGTIILIGTPKVHTDPYVFDIFRTGLDGDDPMYFAMEGDTLEDNEYITAEEKSRILANPKLVQPDGSYTQLGKQVIQGAFVLAGGLFFNRIQVSRMFSGDWEFPKSPQPGHTYLVAWDLGGRKKKSDATVCHVWDVTTRPFECVDILRFEGTEADWEDKYNAIEESWRKWNPPYVLIDVTGSTRDSIAEELERRGIPVEGVHFGGAGQGKKFNMLRSLQSLMEMQEEVRFVTRDEMGEEHEEYRKVKGLVRYPSAQRYSGVPAIKREFDFYTLEDKNLKQDNVMVAAMLGHYALQELVPEPVYGDIY